MKLLMTATAVHPQNTSHIKWKACLLDLHYYGSETNSDRPGVIIGNWMFEDLDCL